MNEKVLLLDMGNVLFPLEFAEFHSWFISLIGGEKEGWMDKLHKVYLEYEVGKFETHEFMNRIQHAYDIQFDEGEFIEKWNSCWQQDMAGMEEVLKNIPDAWRLCLLSNTNELHVRHFETNKSLLGYFDKKFYSHELLCAKPDEAIYQKVLEDLGVEPNLVVFFDDMPENIEAAQSVGMEAHVFQNASQIEERLRR